MSMQSVNAPRQNPGFERPVSSRMRSGVPSRPRPGNPLLCGSLYDTARPQSFRHCPQDSWEPCTEARLLRVAEPVLSQGGLAPWQYRGIAVHVEMNLAMPLRVKHLAALCRLSASHFNRAFKVTFGETPHVYVLKKRIAFAQRMMLLTGEPLCQIAVACGLTDQAHLTNLFRRHTGTTPLRWRELAKFGGGTGFDSIPVDLHPALRDTAPARARLLS